MSVGRGRGRGKGVRGMQGDRNIAGGFECEAEVQRLLFAFPLSGNGDVPCCQVGGPAPRLFSFFLLVKKELGL